MVLPKTDRTLAVDFSTEHARWVGRASFIQMTEAGPVNRVVLADLFARGDEEDEYTPDRGIEAIIKSEDTRHPFTLKYSVRESPSGIFYMLRRFEGKKIKRDFDYPVGANYAYKERRESAQGSISRENLVHTPVNDIDLILNENFTAAMLESAGVRRAEPQQSKSK